MRVGQKNKLTYRWARKGSRPRAVHDQRTQSTYLFGAVCPEHGKGSGLVLPVCNAEAMQLHLDDIAAKVAPRAHAILIFDQAGWHGAKSLKMYKYALDLTVGLRRGGCPTKLVVRRHAAGSIFSLANGKASRKVCIGVLPKHQRP